MKNSFLYKAKFFLAPLVFIWFHFGSALVINSQFINSFIDTRRFINHFYFEDGIKAFFIPFFIFVIVPIFDMITPPSKLNPSSKKEERELIESKIFDILVWFILPLQIAIISQFLIQFHANYSVESPLTLIGWVLSVGMSCGILGINVGHELGHRTNSWQRFVGKALLWTSLRMSFYIEHNWGHHTDVSTDKDPASAKRNEIVYLFIPKSIFKTWLNSWKIQKDLLKKRNVSFFSIYNDVFWYHIIQWGTLIAIALIFNWQTSLAFLGTSLVGMALLELVNYIEHYGLRREINENGKVERVMPIHSWNSNHSISGAVLFNLSRHSDHHYIASRPYQILRNYDTTPNMPTGYAGMIVLSLFPPLWFNLMNKKIDKLMSKENKNQFSEIS